MPFTKYANLDFDQIRDQIKEYLRANSDFTDFDFEGSNFSVLIDTLAYNTYINAFNANMVVNESFLESAALRENVVSLARNIGYLPKSRTASRAKISFSVSFVGSTQTVTLKAGLVCVGSTKNTSFVFSIPEDITTISPLDDPLDNQNGARTATFSDVEIYQGSYASKKFNVDASLDQRFIIDNSYVDTDTLRVRVKGPNDTSSGNEYLRSSSLISVTSQSEIYFLQEVKDEKYELLFGDGIIGKKLETGGQIVSTFIVTDGIEGNGVTNFSFSGVLRGSENERISPSTTINVTTDQKAQGGAEIESLQSIKYFAPATYASQYRAVTASDYETIVKQIFPEASSVSVVGGEEMTPPKFGEVVISIKPKNGYFVSDFNKNVILNRLKDYSVAGIKQTIVDLEVLSIELDCFVYYNNSKVSSIEDLKSAVSSTLSDFASSEDLNNFGGRFKYSKLLKVIDSTSTAITSNITKVKIRRDLKTILNRPSQYELCFGNRFHVVASGANIKSTGFNISGFSETLYMTDTPNADMLTGVISFISIDDNGVSQIVVQDAGYVDYVTGEVNIYSANITNTEIGSGIIEVQAFPESNDVIGLTNLYVELSIGKSTINMVKDTISSGEQISGIGFPVTSSYSNGNLTR
ncbi:baseplate wedge subunit [Synechococcus phage S-T4]|jgi:hypothetical protein|uniref:Baseplate wedge subunit n=1 Tax=Synechococcus phage S-T4 TaxID=2268578 RepID=A0A385EHR9_9CAUD|nr:baseplate wedge subunit [Synechococcus phage S-T4]AXQ70597.1 baseplate wedge subunit [Synechococcus phage S-T4]